MPSTPYAKILVSVGGGALTSGGITAPAGAAIHLQAESTHGWSGLPAPKWEIYEYPEGWSAPSGWSTDDEGVFYFFGVSPPDFSLPDISLWGKFMLRLTVNGSLIDEDTALSVLSAMGFEDLAFGEAKQFDNLRQWAGAVKRSLRLFDAAASTAANATTGAARSPVKAATTANITLSGTQTIDVVSCGVGDRVLVKDQTLQQQNGVYVVASGGWTRAADANTAPLIAGGLIVPVQQGSQNGHTTWKLLTNPPVTLNTTPLIFSLVATSPRMVAARDFAPFPALLGICQPTAAMPIMLSSLYGSLGAAQADFPNLTASAELNSTSYAAGSYDWAVLQETIRYAEAHLNAPVWIDNGLYGLVSGLEGSQGTLLVHGGIVLRGQGAQGSVQTRSVVFTHFATGDLFEYDGGAVGTTQAVGVGGGIRDIVCWKANRVQFGGLSYQGGRGLYVHASDTFRRPGEMIIENLLGASEAGPKHQVAITAVDNTTPIRVHAAAHGLITGARPLIAGTGIGAIDGQGHLVTVIDANTFDVQGTTAAGTSSTGTVTIPAALWDWGVYFDGSALRINGGSGVRSVHSNKLRWTGSTLGFMRLRYVEHHTHIGLDTSIGNSSGEPGGGSCQLIIEGDCNNLAFPGARLHGPVVIQAYGTTNISAMSGSPATITATGHGFPTGQFVRVIIEGTVGTTGVNGLTFLAFVLDANTFNSLEDLAGAPISGAGYASGGTIRSTSPREVHLMGTVAGFVVNNTDATGTAALTHDTDPTRGMQTATVWINKSANFKAIGPYTPSFLLERKSALSNVTGDDTVVNVSFTHIDADANLDVFDAGTGWPYASGFPYSGSGSPFTAYVATCAGKYRFSAQLLLNGADPRIHKYLELAITVNGAVKGTTKREPPMPGLGGQYQTIDLHTPPLLLQKSDVVRVQLVAVGIKVSLASNASPIVITTDVPHNRKTGDTGVVISGCLGNTAANGTWTITVIDAVTCSLNTSTGNGAYTSGGTLGVKNVSVFGDSGSAYSTFSGDLA